MKTKPIPIMITLAAAFISCVASIMQGVDFSVFVSRLAITAVVFLVLGTIIKMILDAAFKEEKTIPIDANVPDIDAIENGISPDDNNQESLESEDDE